LVNRLQTGEPVRDRLRSTIAAGNQRGIGHSP
jgi:hypothetical protein